MNTIIPPIEAAVDLHERYFVSGYETISKVAEVGAKCFEAPLRAASAAFSYSASLLGSFASGTVAKVISAKNAFFPKEQLREIKIGY